MKKIVLIMFFWSTFAISSTIIDSCCPKADTKFEWTSFTVGFVEKPSKDDILNYFESTNSEIFYNKLGIKLSLKGKFVANNTINFSLFKPLNAAFDCFYYFQPKYKITKLQVLPLSDYDQNKLKNSDLSDYFKVLGNNGKLLSVSDFIKDQNDINGVIRDDSRYNEPIILFLQNAPSIDSLFNFVINVKLENDVIFSDTTTVIKIKK
jgi:hypothetical protein